MTKKKAVKRKSEDKKSQSQERMESLQKAMLYVGQQAEASATKLSKIHQITIDTCRVVFCFFV